MESDLAYTNSIIVFDLDDTLYSELQYVYSGYRAVAVQSLPSIRICQDVDYLTQQMIEQFRNNSNAFDWLAKQAECDTAQFIQNCIDTYRFHYPDISLFDGVRPLLNLLRNQRLQLAIITDGRSRTQRNKINALDIAEYFPPHNLFISEETGHEKTELYSWQQIVHQYPNARQFIYIADNPAKDFIMPKKLGWLTVGILDNGNNIHPQDLQLPDTHMPHIWLDDMPALTNYLSTLL